MDGILIFVLVVISVISGNRWDSEKNYWYIIANGLGWVLVSFVFEKLGFETPPIKQEIDGYLFSIGNFIIGCLSAILFGFISKIGKRYPRN